MRCLRCQGMLVNERIFTVEGVLAVSRCVHCGDLIDRTIILNRLASHRARIRGVRRHSHAPSR